MAMAFLLTACNDRVKYNHYVSIPEEGWGKRDTLVFGIDTIDQEGRYTAFLCMRTNAQYPYRYLTLNAKVRNVTQNEVENYTVSTEIKQEEGVSTGTGITYFSYEIPLATKDLHKGDSLSVAVCHHMRREYMPGITDVGVKLLRK